MTQHHFHLQANWPGGRNSSGYIDAGELKTKISIPPEMDGPGIGTNPDEMLLGAAATCYVITLAAMIERASDRKSTRLNSSHVAISYAVFCLKKNKDTLTSY